MAIIKHVNKQIDLDDSSFITIELEIIVNENVEAEMNLTLSATLFDIEQEKMTKQYRRELLIDNIRTATDDFCYIVTRLHSQMRRHANQLHDKAVEVLDSIESEYI